MIRAAVLALALAGCSSGDSLVVVSVGSSVQLDGLALLHTSSLAGGMLMDHDVGADQAPFSIPPAKTFGVQVPKAITGMFSVRVEARNAAGMVLATGDSNMITLAPGSRVDVSVTLAPGGAVVSAQPVWIGSGGSAIANGSGARLNVGIGAVDTVGKVTAASGASFTPGYFGLQTAK
jgi:hypothetical protein